MNNPLPFFIFICNTRLLRNNTLLTLYNNRRLYLGFINQLIYDLQDFRCNCQFPTSLF